MQESLLQQSLVTLLTISFLAFNEIRWFIIVFTKSQWILFLARTQSMSSIQIYFRYILILSFILGLDIKELSLPSTFLSVSVTLRHPQKPHVSTNTENNTHIHQLLNIITYYTVLCVHRTPRHIKYKPQHKYRK
jgi:hypothetical protein